MLTSTPSATALIPVGGSNLIPAIERTRDYVEASKAPATRRAYGSDWQDFNRWCTRHQLAALPATEAAVCLYISQLAETHKPSSIQRRIAAISQAHQMAGHETPTQSAAVRTVMAGIRRSKGVAPACKDPVLIEDVRRMVSTLTDGNQGRRDRALLLLGFAGGFRRSEVVGLDVNDIAFTNDGIVVTLRHSKTDQEGQGRKIGIPYGSNPETCPVRAVRAWLDAAGLTEGPLFRPVDRAGHIGGGRLSGRAVALIVKRHVAAIGKRAERFAGHSLRAGLVTSATIGGASERSIMAQTGHRSVNMVRRYIRDASLFRDNAAAQIGL